MSNFASSVMLGDLNDFITPAQACVNPLFVEPKKGKAKDILESEQGHLPKVGLVIENDFNAVEISAPPTVQVQNKKQAPDLIKTSDNHTAKVSLTDCLACSGCVTSAETVLIEQQSSSEFLSNVSSSKYEAIVVTISTQTLASLAVHFGCSSMEARKKVSAFLEGLGVHHLIDSGCAGDIALLEAGAEFLHRYRNRETFSWTRPETSVAESRITTKYLDDQGNTIRSDALNGSIPSATKLPMLSSACPGWICFAEKTHPEALPYVSTTMSPQEISGVLVKQFISKIKGVDSSKIYHCCVMPCPDKKLEASRKDFYNPDSLCNDVDCVLTSNELLDMLTENGITNLAAVSSSDEGDKMDVDNVLLDFSDLSSCSREGRRLVSSVSSDGGSGGYLDFVFRLAAKELFDVTVPDGPLPFKQGRNVDIRTIELQVGGKVVLNFATAYGFRNIQSIIRQMKRNKCPHDFVEIMACPGGCLNGGGQIRIRKTSESSQISNDLTSALEKKLSENESNRARLEEISHKFHDRVVRSAEENTIVQKIYSEVIEGKPYSEQARRFLHTRYHAVPKLQNPLMQQW
mmetsp:Transcript_16155/g.20033  ORF Transcript_16155/g.20033 Transcript_16155/m.20033 type:complete len:574 (-) Transcript_16155:227-1948(-)|eukprot:CAMPEP_0204887018 /NCGR_PEP_ID=MMETSP1349-20130617/16664_1 /ASSEMBLY_ACC=CAM_ASM_000710 /TAXON_ID=215587 /ORGANISM="Aplanochytrium stocchinoi, Strain GSBS06" /LENGTH=573 /DNA_ID=CAMNT_0052049469 /DNA_START=67 /DNA_END=1788 /DNA_ORIENTATION=+